MANVYSQPTYAQSSQGTANAPKLGASSDNISGYDKTTAAILDAVKKDAATNGLTAWGLSFLKQLGETIKPEWLKENSKEWFNKPLPDPLVPPKDEFLKLVEPAVRSLTKPSVNAGEQGINVGGGWTEAIRDKGGFGGLWEKYHKEAGDLDAQYAQMPAYLDPKRIAENWAKFGPEAEDKRERAKYADAASKAGVNVNTTPIWQLKAMSEGKRFDGMPEGYTPTNFPAALAGPAPLPQSGYNPAGGLVNTGKPLQGDMTSSIAADAQAKINKQFEKQNEVTFDRKAALEAFKARQAALPANTAGPPINALALNAAMMANATVNGPNMLQTTYADPSAPLPTPSAQKTFLPPYLQPGAPTDANNITGAKLPVATQIASPTPIAPPITPFTPLMPQGFATPRPVTPGLFPAMAGMPRAGGFGGGFGATAKLLELPFYLQNFGGINYGR